DHAMTESSPKSRRAPRRPGGEVKARVASLAPLDHPRTPSRQPDGGPTPAARRGQDVFRSAKAACNPCHNGPEFTDGKIHMAGLEERDDAYKGYNPPSLRDVYDKDTDLHARPAETLPGSIN